MEGNERWTQDFPCSEHKCKVDLATTENIPDGMVDD